MNCPECGTQTKTGAGSCPQCGAGLSKPGSGTPSSLSATQLQDLPGASPSTQSLEDVVSPESELGQGQVLLGRYEVREEIGRGGMGVVFSAFDRSQSREIALKVLLPHLVSNEAAQQAFLQEGRIASQLSHPGILNVFDATEDAGVRFLVMERLTGRTLRELIDEQKAVGAAFEIDFVQRVARDLADALQYAHQFTVHRDVKPENIFVCDDGAVKLMDFGIAKLMDVSTLTKTGVSMGTAYYMAPEQLQGQTVDARADQYALAVVLYELLSLQLPTGMAKPLRQLRSETPKSLGNAITRALAGDPSERFDSMQSFATSASAESPAWMLGGDSDSGGTSRAIAALLAILLVVALVVLGDRRERELAPVAGGGASPTDVSQESRGTNDSDLSSLVSLAAAQLDANKLTTPAGDNAFETFSRILAVDSSNSDALVGVAEIRDRYVGWARAAIGRRDYSKARSHIAKAQRVAPGDPELADLEAKVASSIFEEERVRRELADVRVAAQVQSTEILARREAAREECNAECEDDKDRCFSNVRDDPGFLGVLESLGGALECIDLERRCKNEETRKAYAGQFGDVSRCFGISSRCEREKDEHKERAEEEARDRCESRFYQCRNSC